MRKAVSNKTRALLQKEILDLFANGQSDIMRAWEGKNRRKMPGFRAPMPEFKAPAIESSIAADLPDKANPRFKTFEQPDAGSACTAGSITKPVKLVR